jgi:hypothetical protein
MGADPQSIHRGALRRRGLQLGLFNRRPEELSAKVRLLSERQKASARSPARPRAPDATHRRWAAGPAHRATAATGTQGDGRP